MPGVRILAVGFQQFIAEVLCKIRTKVSQLSESHCLKFSG